MIVYVVQKGEYSDRTICAVATDPSIAEEIRRRCSSDYTEAFIETFETDVLNPVLDGMPLYHVRFDPHGNITVNEEAQSYEWDYLHDNLQNVTERRDGNLEIFVLAWDAAHAKKIACDRRAQYLAEREGI